MKNPVARAHLRATVAQRLHDWYVSLFDAHPRYAENLLQRIEEPGLYSTCTLDGAPWNRPAGDEIPP